MIVRRLPVLVALALALACVACGDAREAPLPPLPHTVAMAGRDIDLVEAGIAAYDRGELQRARTDFRNALAIRADTAVAHFNLGVTETLLTDRETGAQEMRRGFALANAHGMAKSPQASAMRAIARQLGIDLR